MSINSDLTAIKTIQDGVKNNKVTRFAYTQTAYTNNDVNGHDDYVATRDNNIPLPDLSVIQVNPTVVDKGFRARASSVPRMLLNHLFGRTSYNLNKLNDLFNELLAKIIASLGVADGIATLDSTGRIPYSQLPEDAMEYQGDWNASTNTPTLVDGTGTKGDTYSVTVAGTQTFGGETINFFVGDRIIYNGSIWQRASSGNVQSVSDILPEPENGNVDLSKQTDMTKLFNSAYLDKLFTDCWYKLWKTGTVVDSNNYNSAGGQPYTNNPVAYGNGIYVAVAGNSVFTSTDCKNWNYTFRWLNSGSTTVSFRKLAFVPNARGNTGVFMLTGTNEGSTTTNDRGGVWISTDGTNWERYLSNLYMEGCGGYENHLVASTMSHETNEGQYESFDGGLTWQKIEHMDEIAWDYCAYQGMIFGIGESYLTMYTLNHRWERDHFNVSTGQCTKIGKYKVLIGTRATEGGGIFANSGWGTYFTRVLAVSSGSIYTIAFEDDMFVSCVCSTSPAEIRFVYSLNGTDWYWGTSFAVPIIIRNIVKNGKRWFASGSIGTSVYSPARMIFMSKDGKVWEEIDTESDVATAVGIPDEEETAGYLGFYQKNTPSTYPQYSGRQEMLEYVDGEQS